MSRNFAHFGGQFGIQNPIISDSLKLSVPLGLTQDAPSTKLPQLRKNKPGAMKERNKPPERNNPTTKRSLKSATTDPAATKNALQSTRHTDLHNH